ncbi:MAG: SDH family Clp fold serine proteinase, partial [Minisyncoccia bacterium]
MERKELKGLEMARGSRVIAYITGDRQGPNARIAPDIIPFFSQQLDAIAPNGKIPKIDLFIYSTGGDTMVPWRLVSVIREHCDSFSVLVPYKAHSAATMIALGADEVVMTGLSELSPIDPSTANVFNPQDPANPQNRVPISVEDVVAYFDLAKNKFGIKSDADLTAVFNKFVDANPQVHPLALGNVNRVHNLIRIIAKRLLKSHKKPMTEQEIDRVVEFFTEKLYSHQYYVGRKEARDELGLKTVVDAESHVAKTMNDLYESYRAEMGLGATIWNPELELGNANQTRKEYKIACIESSAKENYFQTALEFRRQQAMVPQQTP